MTSMPAWWKSMASGQPLACSPRCRASVTHSVAHTASAASVGAGGDEGLQCGERSQVLFTAGGMHGEVAADLFHLLRGVAQNHGIGRGHVVSTACSCASLTG